MSRPVVVIVGAGPGIGAATGRRFAEAGYDVGLIARDSGRVEKLGASLTDSGATVGIATVDVLEDEALAHALVAMGEHNGRLDVLVYNAVAPESGPKSEMSAADLLQQLKVESAALLTCLQAVLPMLRVQHTGTVLITSRPGHGLSMPSSLVHSLDAELRREGLHFATVQVKPGTDPELVAGAYTDLAAETAQHPATWRTEVML